MSDTIRFYDPHTPPFSIHGLADPMAPMFRRVPADVAEATNDGVAGLALHTSGVRLRFTTDSSFMVIRVRISTYMMPHATPLMEAGFDLYADIYSNTTPRLAVRHDYLGYFGFDPASRGEYESRMELPAGTKELTLNFPLYGSVESLEIGLDPAATVGAHTPYAHAEPIVFYGSSITQGGCASRPGTCYQNLLCRRFDCDYIDLGFSGSAKGEDAIVNYMASLPMAAFVSDYDHNAPTVEHLRATHHKLYEAIRKTHPDIPYIMLTKPDFFYGADDMARRDTVMESYLEARRNGDTNVYFVDGASYFAAAPSRRDCTMDNCHPNDTGFVRMAATIGDALFYVMPW